MKKIVANIVGQFTELNEALSLSVNLTHKTIAGGIFKIHNKEVSLLQPYDELLKEEIEKKSIILSLEGKGVMSKWVEASFEKIKIRNTFPSLKEEDFYFTYVPSGNGTWISLVRKNTVDQILKKYNIKLEQVIDLHIGPSHVQYLSRFVKELPPCLGENELTFIDGNLKSIVKSPEQPANTSSLLFDNLLPKNMHLPFVSALISLNQLNTQFKFEQWNIATKTQLNKKQFYNVSKLVLGTLLLVFLTNMIINELYKKTYNRISAEASQFENLNRKAKELKDGVNQKTEFINQLNLDDNPQFSSFIDQIGFLIPPTIQLLELKVNPLNKSIRKNKLIDFERNIVVIRGLTSAPSTCNKLKASIRELHWIKRVELTEYKVNKQGIGEFQIDLEF